jgi:hypothetical protein
MARARSGDGQGDVERMLKDALERAIEAALVKRVTALGGVTIKIMLIRGFPDRLVFLPGGRVVAVETKRPQGGRLSPHQKRWIDRLRGLGIETLVVRNETEIDRLFG